MKDNETARDQLDRLSDRVSEITDPFIDKEDDDEKKPDVLTHK